MDAEQILSLVDASQGWAHNGVLFKAAASKIVEAFQPLYGKAQPTDQEKISQQAQDLAETIFVTADSIFDWDFDNDPGIRDSTPDHIEDRFLAWFARSFVASALAGHLVAASAEEIQAKYGS